MLDIGGWELLLIGALALIIVGPKDLPRLVREVGRWAARARGLADEFRRGMDEAAKEADLEEVRKAATVKTEVGKELSSLGEQAKRMIESPKAGAPTPLPVAKPAEAGRESVRETPKEPSIAAPQRTPAAAREEADPDSFLDEFQRGLRGDSES